MTEPTNAHRSINDWMIHIDGKLDRLNETVGAKLDEKADKDDVDRNADDIRDLRKTTSKLGVKQAGIAATVSVLLIALKSFFIPSS